MLERFDEQARETIDKMLSGAEQRKAADQAARRVAKVKRELREEFQTTVLSTQDDARQGALRLPKIEEGVRVRLEGVREPARVRRKLGSGRIEVEAGFMKMQVSMDDVLEVLPEEPAGSQAAEGRHLQTRTRVESPGSGDQRHRAARRGGPR